MLHTEILRPRDLTAGHCEAWRELCAAEPMFASPLLGPDFAAAVGRVRDDAAVAIWRRDGEIVAILPHHRRPNGHARPIGAPFSDYHAVIARPDLGAPGADLLRLAGIDSFRFTSLVDPHGLFAAARSHEQAGHVIVLDEPAQTRLEAIRAASPKKFKNYRRLEHKLEREVGTVSFAADQGPDAFQRMLSWKSEQLRRTGLHDFLAQQWTSALMEQLFERQDGAFQGLLVTLRAGGKLVAGHFGVRLGEAYHPWIAASDPRYGAYSPGHVFLSRAIAAMPDLGLTHYDLSGGHDHYKTDYVNQQRPVMDGQAFARTFAGRMRERIDGALTVAGHALDGARIPASRVRRRLDQIATLETSLAGRLNGVAGALAGMSRRSQSMAVTGG